MAPRSIKNYPCQAGGRFRNRDFVGVKAQSQSNPLTPRNSIN